MEAETFYLLAQIIPLSSAQITLPCLTPVPKLSLEQMEIPEVLSAVIALLLSVINKGY